MRRCLAIALLVILAACQASSGGDDPTPNPDVTTVASPEASPPSGGEAPTEAPGATGEPAPTDGPAADALLAATLIDVRTGEEFTLGALAADGPVLVETMAIWCINCLGQQRQVVAAHDLAAFASVSIDVDPNERADDLADYAEREGFDWRFVLADAELATMLRERFSPQVLNPPSMPKLLIEPDGSVELVGVNEQLSAEVIAALVGG